MACKALRMLRPLKGPSWLLMVVGGSGGVYDSKSLSLLGRVFMVKSSLAGVAGLVQVHETNGGMKE